MADLTRVVGLEHLDAGSLTVRRWDDLSSLYEGTSFTRVFRAGQVLFGKRRVYQRKVAVPDFDGICSGDILVLESQSEDLLSDLLPLLLRTDAFLEHALGTSAGSLSPRTKWSELATFQFWLPPIDEQKRIIDVASRFTRCRSAVEGIVSTSIDAAKSLRQALLEATESSDFVRCDEVADVQVGKKLSPAKRQGVRPRPYLRAVNLKLDGISLADVKEMDFTEAEDETLAIQKGDILLVEGGNRDSVGAPTLVEETPESPLYIQNTVVRLRLRKGSLVTTDFLYWAWRALFETGQFEKLAVGTKLYHLGPGRVAGVQIPLPAQPFRTQWTDNMSAVAEIRRAAIAHLASIDVLEHATLQYLLDGGGDVH